MFQRKQKQFFLVATFVVLFFGLASIVQAQEDLVPCTSTACTWCDIFKLIQNVVNLGTEIIGPIALLAFMGAGVYYLYGSLNGNENAIDRAKTIIGQAVIGLIITLCTFVIVNTVLVVITGTPVDSFFDIDCTDFQIGPEIPPIVPPGSGGGGDPGPGGDGDYTEDEARATLLEEGIVVPKNACPPGADYHDIEGGCTSLVGIQEDTIDGVIDFAEACKAADPSCVIIITGGTELGHDCTPYAESHCDGSKVDIEDTEAVNDYIEGTFGPSICSRGSDPVYTDGNGNYYVGEDIGEPGGHWDVCYGCSAPCSP